MAARDTVQPFGGGDAWKRTFRPPKRPLAVLGIGLLALGLLGALIAGVRASEAGDPARLPINVAFCGLMLALVARTFVMGVTATPDGVVVRNLFRTRRLPWSAIDHFEIGRSKYRLPIAVAVLPDGDRLEMNGVQRTASGDQHFASETTAALNELLAEQQGRRPDPRARAWAASNRPEPPQSSDRRSLVLYLLLTAALAFLVTSLAITRGAAALPLLAVLGLLGLHAAFLVWLLVRFGWLRRVWRHAELAGLSPGEVRATAWGRSPGSRRISSYALFGAGRVYIEGTGNAVGELVPCGALEIEGAVARELEVRLQGRSVELRSHQGVESGRELADLLEGSVRAPATGSAPPPRAD
jgi:hypothetical protein